MENFILILIFGWLIILSIVSLIIGRKENKNAVNIHSLTRKTIFQIKFLKDNFEKLKQSIGDKLGELKKKLEYMECEEHNITIIKTVTTEALNSTEKPTELVYMTCTLCKKEWFKNIYTLNIEERKAYFAFKKVAPNNRPPNCS